LIAIFGNPDDMILTMPYVRDNFLNLLFFLLLDVAAITPVLRSMIFMAYSQ
jgi:hypothetical protein